MKKFYKFRQNLSGRYANQRHRELIASSEQGFTLIELLVVIIIIGLLALIALPSMLRQVNKAQAAGAKTHLGALNRAQQAYLMKNATFASTLDELAAGVPQETTFHSYGIQSATKRWTILEASPKSNGVMGYAAVVYINDNEINTTICEGQVGTTPSVTFVSVGPDWILSGCTTSMP
jgi:type IV pilus assembly protein PilA